jgi:hypothetical protein
MRLTRIEHLSASAFDFAPEPKKSYIVLRAAAGALDGHSTSPLEDRFHPEKHKKPFGKS